MAGPCVPIRFATCAWVRLAGNRLVRYTQTTLLEFELAERLAGGLNLASTAAKLSQGTSFPFHSQSFA